MYSTVRTAIPEGIETIPIGVEVDISTGLPMFDMVGSLSPEVREAKERVRTALANSGIPLPARRITINLSPANVRKSGTGFDLPIAVGLLQGLGIVEEELCRDLLFLGELGLNGSLKAVPGVLPVVADGVRQGITEFVLPLENLREAKLVKGAKIYAFSNIGQVIEFLNGVVYEEPKLIGADRPPAHKADFAEVNGQHFLKRACEVAASGMHNMLIVGPPGAGKTMISERMGSILPPLTEEERMELSRIYSVCGLLDNQNALIDERPFRAPHHTITRAGLTGGGFRPRPGEISLAHHGVLFLDELPEFQKNHIEVLRQPLEEGEIRLTRGNHSVTYPADFLLLAAMNPCPCGFYPDMQKCRCSRAALERYISQISQPILDRIDLCVEARAMTYNELTGTQPNESSEVIRGRVSACHQIQYERYHGEGFLHNCQIPSSRLAEFCPLGKKEQAYMAEVFERMNLTGRSYHKILRVARTLADMEEAKEIRLKDLNEAVCYRSITEKYWGGVRL